MGARRRWAVAGLALALASPPEAIAQEWEVIAHEPLLVKVRPRGSTGLREVWAEGELDATVQDLQSAILDAEAYPRFMPYVKEVRTLEITPEGESLIYTRLEPPLLGARDYVVLVQVHKQVGTDGSREFANTWHAVPNRLPRRRAVVRLPVCEGSWEIGPAPSGRARAVYRTAVDPGVTMPRFLSDLANSIGAQETFRAVEREARRRGEVRRAAAANGGSAHGPAGSR